MVDWKVASRILKPGLLLVLAFGWALVACQGNVGQASEQQGSEGQIGTQVGDGFATREFLTVETLFGEFNQLEPFPEEYLLPIGPEAPATHNFEGRLVLHGVGETGGIEIVKGSPALAEELRYLPEFGFEFIQDQGHFIPVQRGLIITEDPTWNIMLEPGKVWDEAGDEGYSRVSFPFALIPKGSNATFVGTMMFVFDEDEISKIWYQITQEATFSSRANLWGLLEAEYQAYEVENSEDIRAEFREELRSRLPTKSIEELAVDFPGVDPEQFGVGVTDESTNWYGVVVNGIHYLSKCNTRFGQYPYCESMRTPSYSTAKSFFIGLSIMRMAEKYGPDVLDLLVKDYVPETAASPGDWSSVRFEDVWDMATGNFESSGYMVDEEHFDTDPFWLEDFYAEKIEAALNWPHSAEPGTVWVYRTMDTFILSTALTEFLKTKEGPDADLYEFLVDEVYRPIGINPGAYTVLRTKDDNWQGVPLGGLGQWWIPDDFAKIAQLVQNRGEHDGVQILDPQILDRALFRDGGDMGLAIPGGARYNNSFWGSHYSTNNGFACEFWTAQALGISGIVVSIMPNGVTYYYGSDDQQFTWDTAVREADKMIPFCPAAE